MTGRKNRSLKFLDTIIMSKMIKVENVQTEAEKIDNIILDQYKSQLISRNVACKEAHVQAKALKSKLNKQKLRDLKREIMQDGELVSSNFFNDIKNLLDRIGCKENQSFFVSLLHLVLDLYFADSIPHYASAVIHFIRSVLPDNFVESAISFFVKFVEPYFTTIQDGKLFGEQTIESLSDLFKMKATALKSKTWEKICDLCNYVICLILGIAGDSDTMFMNKIKGMVTKPVDLGLPLLMGLFESLIYLIRQGYQSFHTRTPMSFFYEETSLSKWIESVDKINLDYININSPDPLLRRQRVEILSDMRGILEKGKQMKTCVTGFQATVLKTAYSKLMITTNDLHNSMTASKFRRAPFVLLINGIPSVGKTSFVNHCASFFASVRKLSLTDECRYVRQFMDAFWSGLKSTHWFILFDDIAFEHPNKVMALSQSSLGDFIQVANNVVMAPNMANLEEKGKVFCMPELLIGTTNCKHLNAQHLFETPYAVNRRFPYVVTLVPKGQVRDSNGGLQLTGRDPIEQELIDEVGDDWWHITVEKPVVMSIDGVVQKQASYAHVSDFESMTDFRCWLKKAIHDHVTTQDKIISFHEKREKMIYCNECCEEKDSCTCAVMQDGFVSRCFEACSPVDKTVFMSYWQFILGCILSLFFRFIFDKILLAMYDVSWGTPWSLPWIFAYYFSRYIYRCDYISSFLYFIYLWLPSWARIALLKWFARNRAMKFLQNQRQYLGYAKGLIALLALYKATTIVQRACGYKNMIAREAEEKKKEEHYTPDKLVEQQNINDVMEKQIEVAEQRLKLAKRLSDLQGGLISTPAKDVYYQSTEKSIAFDFGNKITSWKAMPFEESIEKIQTNVVRIHSRESQKTGCGIFISGQVLITNYHLFANDHTFQIFHERRMDVVSSWMKIPDSDIVLDKEHDLMAIRFRNIPPSRSLVDLIPQNALLDIRCAVSIVTRCDCTNELLIHGSKNCFYRGKDTIVHDLLGEAVFEFYSAVGNSTIKGDCGSPYVANSPYGPCILALHQNVKLGLSSGVVLTRPIIDELISSLCDGVQGGSLLRTNYTFALQPWSKDSNLRRIENPHCYIFGTSQRRFPSKSHVEKSLLYQRCIEKGMIDDFGKPIMRHRNVWINQAMPMVKRDFSIDLALLDKATTMFIDESVLSISQEDFSVVRVLSDDEALNGVQGLAYVDKIPRKTSAGFPHNCSKMKFLDFIGDQAVLNSEIQDDANEIEQILMSSCRSMSIFMASLKDEVVTAQKAVDMKTRVFTGSPLAFSLVMRKYLLTTNAFIQSHRRQFECCVGVDALGPEWEDITKFLVEFSPNFIAGDYANYDKTMTADLILSAGKVLIAICVRSGYSDEQISVVRTLMYDLAFPVCNFDGDIIMTCGSEPSGHPLTVIVNSIVGSILLRMAFINLNVNGNFKEHVRAIIYGDDNLMSSKLLDFNHCYLQDFFLSQGLVYTMAEKGAKSIPFVPMSECTFLKRDFFFHPELKHFVGRLSEKSIRKMLMYRLPKGAMDSNNHAIEVMDTSCREMFFWGREKFEEHRNWCLENVSKLGLQECVRSCDFADFHSLSEWYLMKWDEFQALPLSSRTFNTGTILQGGCMDVQEDKCQKCGESDCFYHVSDAIICRRCRRCRPSVPCRFDKWFLGCFYCEEAHPLHCDCCFSSTVNMQVYESDGITTHFYCKQCSYVIEPRASCVVLIKRSNNSYTRMPLSRFTRRTAAVTGEEVQDGYLVCEDNIIDSSLYPKCDEDNTPSVYFQIFMNMLVILTCYFHIILCLYRKFYYGKRFSILFYIFVPYLMAICNWNFGRFLFGVVNVVAGYGCLNLLFLPILYHFRRWWKVVFYSSMSSSVIRTGFLKPVQAAGRTFFSVNQGDLSHREDLSQHGLIVTSYLLPTTSKISYECKKNSRVLSEDTRVEWNSQQTHIQDGDVVEQETVSFMDLQPAPIVEIPRSVEEVSNSMAMDSVSLADFLSRPVLVNTTSWTEADAAGLKSTIAPWLSFFNTATIKYKTNNWAFIKCNLHLRVVFNASPFYYGSMMASWSPMHSMSPPPVLTNGLLQFIPISQYPGRAMIEPQCPEDIEISLPFLWPVNFLRLQDSNDFTKMGYLFYNIINPLKSANGVVGTGITIKTYAWATDVVLSGPSVGLAMQDGKIDEYAMDGPVSKPASAIANIASRLGDIPIIGRFATATMIGANAVGHIAKLFGFTNVPVVKDQKGFQPRALPPIATTDIGYPFEKLTLDSKNELTIDHRSVGLDAQDELPIASIVQRESYLTSFDWSSAEAADTLLFTSAVTPELYNATADVHPVLYMTPMCWLSTMFNYWRGDVIFRFRVVCSKYHRGRLKISYDPDGYAALNVTTDQSSHLVMTKMIDIDEDTNVEIRIPYQQYRAWCSSLYANQHTEANKLWGAAGFKHIRGRTNGSLAVTIQTILTAPVDASVVSVQVYVRGAENMDFASPHTMGTYNLSSAVLQDGEISEVSVETQNQSQREVTSISSGAISSPIDHLYLTYMGERVASLRVLLRRQCKVFTFAAENVVAKDYMTQKLTYPRVPPPVGFNAYALDTVVGLLDPLNTYKFNWTQGNFLSYIMPAFKANRGSVNWTALFDIGDETGPLKSFTAYRDPGATTIHQQCLTQNISTQSTNDYWWWHATASVGSGACLATGVTSNAANWQMPYYSYAKFNLNDAANINKASYFSNNDCWTAEWNMSGAIGPSPVAPKMHLYAGAGTDFDLIYFMCIPTYTVMTTAPTPV